MARKRQPDEPKLRTREHVVADLAVNHLERQVLLCGYAVNRLYVDYGIDLRITTFDTQGRLEAGPIYCQVKGTDHISIDAERAVVEWRIERSDLVTWLRELYPVILVVYDAQQDRAYWLHVQGHFATLPDFDLFAAGRTVPVAIPLDQVLTVGAIALFAMIRDVTSPARQ